MKGILFALALMLPLAAQDWPKVTPESWEAKPLANGQNPSAVVLADRYEFRRKGLERFRRVLVLNREGRRYAEYTLLGDRFRSIRGRTLLPDGREVPFTQGVDVLRKTLVKIKGQEYQAIQVLPAGMEDRCVVDLRWEEPKEETERPIHEDLGLSLTTSLSGEVPVRLVEVVVGADLLEFGWLRKFEILPGLKWKESQEKGSTIYRFEDIPPRPRDFLASNADLRMPLFHWFWSPDLPMWMQEVGFKPGVAVSTFDAYAACVFYYTLIEKGPTEIYLEKLLPLALGTPEDPERRAEEVIRRLRARIKTLAELPEPPTGKALQKGAPHHAFDRGWGNGWQINMMAFYALRKAGLNPAMVYLIDREENRLSDPTNLWQYDHAVVAITDAKGGLRYLDPGDTYSPMALRPWFQASKGLLIQPGKGRLDWKGRIVNTPMAPASENRHTWKAEVTLSDRVNYRVSYEGTGAASSDFRQRLNAHAKDPLPALKGFMGVDGFRVSGGEVPNLRDPWTPLTFSVEGSLDLEEGRRVEVAPFSFLKLPFAIPDTWPETRTTNIHFPMTCVVEAEAFLPWKPEAGALEPLENRNALGEVRWAAEPVEGGRRLKVSLSITVRSLIAATSQYGDLKAFLTWIEEARRRRIQLP